MHRATPANTSFRSYVAGGARATIPAVDDSKWMQESQGHFMANEARTGIEAPQNYGFTSVCADATKDAMGKITACAESFVQFMGGNRSFPVFGNMDDRRHRLLNLAKGDVAVFRQALDKLQMHMSADGWFATGPRDKTLRMQMLDEDSGQQQQSAAPAAMATDASGGSSGQSSSQQSGQQARYKDAQSSFRFVELTKDKSRMGGTTCHMVLNDGKTYLHCYSDKQVYVGGDATKNTFDYLVTVSGPCINSKGRIG
jgi:hypothetical protein